jgi:meso-butanediol dehydrogenase/(S,S)-butanediol dehydrogenase/diacetyl reductase
MIDLVDRVAVVTGGSSGIGAACAHRLIDEGAFVVVAGRNEKRTREVCASCSAPDRASPALGDVRHVSHCRRIIQTAIDRHGRIDILVNSAGVLVYKPFLEVTEKDFDLCIETNLKGACFTTQAALHFMIPQNRGVIINITSVAGHSGTAGETIYCSSKGGLVLLTRSLARELSSTGVRFVSVAPAIIEGPMTDQQAAAEPDPEAFLESLAEDYPLGRFGRPEEIAAVVAFLASGEAEWITGCSWIVDGGLKA